MQFQIASYSNIGSRENNEDACYCSYLGDSLLLLVADGVGGHEHGQLASRLAVQTICSELEGETFGEDGLIEAIQFASSCLHNNPDAGLSTITALWILGNRAIAVHVGDSRIYQFRDGKIQYQSLDHSVVQMAVLVGELEPEAVRSHPDRNRIIRVLGGENPPRVDSRELTVQPGDRFLLCTDGFWEPVWEKDMLALAREHENAEPWLSAMSEIVFDANDPKQDNHTAAALVVRE